VKAGKYTYKELFVNRYVSQLVVPEIQRDYVWKKEQLEGFLGTVCDDFRKFKTEDVPIINPVGTPGKADYLQNDFSEFYRKRNFSANIGFIYAYSDEQYTGRYFLIDGQQRITTLYLLLLVLASRNGQADDFGKNYCNKLTPILDYRVRDSAQQFLHQLVPYVLNNSTDDIEEQSWYLNAYKRDVTINNILKNISEINNWLDTQKNNSVFEFNEWEFYDYIQNFTEFWYFDTNISAQGENLYIYLNARGEQMQGNENLKAELLSRLSSDEEKNTWGRKWEEWQDYFWKHRGTGKLSRHSSGNLNADDGFNEFLICIAALSLYLNDDKSSHLDKEERILPSLLSNILTLELIERYVTALQFMDEHSDEFFEKYSYAGWFEECIDELWKILNFTNTSWFVDYSDSRFSTETNHMVFIWGILHWVSSAVTRTEPVPLEDIYRGIRQFYLRYHNNVRSVRAITNSIDGLLKTGFISNDNSSEEYIKERWLAEQGANRCGLEALIWEIEDHPYNLDGSDVGLINISHLVDFDDTLSTEKLTKIKSAFYECFPVNTNTHKPMQSLLLYYGEFWQKKSPWYYENYQFNDWKKIIRHKHKKEDIYYFRILLDELIETELSHQELLESKRNNIPAPETPDNLRNQLLWYNHHLKENMWKKGNYIAISYQYDGDDKDKIFPERAAFYNTKGDFRGYGHTALSALLPQDVIDLVSH